MTREAPALLLRMAVAEPALVRVAWSIYSPILQAAVVARRPLGRVDEDIVDGRVEVRIPLKRSVVAVSSWVHGRKKCDLAASLNDRGHLVLVGDHVLQCRACARVYLYTLCLDLFYCA